MFTRKVVTASAAALAVVALSVPSAHAQDGDPGSGGGGAGSAELGSLDAGSLVGGSLEGGGLGEGSADAGSAEGGSSEGSGESGSLEPGSLDSASADDSSLGDLVPDSEATCELPDLGGSVAKFYPLFGLSGIPTGVIDLVTSALGSFPNVLDVVAGEGGGAALVGDTGSFAEPLCTSIFGGEMVLPPVTVIVDGDDNPVSTVTGTVAPGAASAAASTSTLDQAPAAAPAAAGAAAGAAPADGGAPDEGVTGIVALPTSVPTPGA